MVKQVMPCSNYEKSGTAKKKKKNPVRCNKITACRHMQNSDDKRKTMTKIK